MNEPRGVALNNRSNFRLLISSIEYAKAGGFSAKIHVEYINVKIEMIKVSTFGNNFSRFGTKSSRKPAINGIVYPPDHFLKPSVYRSKGVNYDRWF